VGFVLDAKLTSRQWVQALPATAQPLPMLEPALILGIDDPARLRQAMADYRTILNELIGKVRELSGNVLPEFQIPPPQSRKVEGGTLYYYPLPELLGLDAALLPNAGLGEKVATLAISASHSERLLKATPLRTESKLLADPKRPLAAAVVADYPALLDALTPWVELGMTIMEASLAQTVEGEKGLEDLPKQARTVIEVLKVFRGYTSVTYAEGGAWVTHGETVIRDLP
jgi:hypothetical protein